MIELLLGVAILLFIRKRMRASFIQSQKENLISILKIVKEKLLTSFYSLDKV